MCPGPTCFAAYSVCVEWGVGGDGEATPALVTKWPLQGRHGFEDCFCPFCWLAIKTNIMVESTIV